MMNNNTVSSERNAEMTRSSFIISLKAKSMIVPTAGVPEPAASVSGPHELWVVILEAHTQSAMAAVALAGKERTISPLFWDKCRVNHTVYVSVNHMFP